MSDFRSLYVHVPFCRHRCGYCDFTLIAGRDDLIGDYLKGLARELDLLGHVPVREDERPELDTLFFGGGTPTHLPPQELTRLFQIVSSRFRLAEGAEVCVEANPRDLTDERLDVLRRSGVNRLSLGGQSFDARALELLERDHAPEELAEIVRRITPDWENVSLDLIFGVPGQTLESWEETLQRAISLGVSHVSTYGLTFEANTAFETRRRRGELEPVDEELERAMYDVAMEQLEAAGYSQYEISSFAKPGFACRHNQIYWSGDEYEAVGPGAARYLEGARETNIRSVLGWLARLERGESPVAEAEELAPEARARELIFLNLRRVRGIDRTDFRTRTGFSLDRLAGPAILHHTQAGNLEDDGPTIRLTRAGRFLADHVMADFLG